MFPPLLRKDGASTFFESRGRALEEDGGEPGAGWVVVEAGGHKVQGLYNTEAVGEAPAEKFGVAGRD